MSFWGGTLARLRSPSLARRLVMLAVGWSLASLLIVGVVLALQFQRAALRSFDSNLSDLIDNLLAGSTVENGEVVAPALTDLKALRAYSGRYWEIAEVGPDGRLRALEGLTSRSLYDTELRTPADLAARLRAKPAETIAYDTAGPQAGERVRVMSRWTRFYGREAPVVYLAAENRAPVDREVRNFITATAVAFLLLGALLIGAVVIQVRVGLRPLFRLGQAVADVRRGKAERLGTDYPSELRPLTDELNALVTHNQETVERQRTHVGNLAHALKTPISVMMAEAGQRPGALAEVVTRQADVMRQQVDHHLRRARAAARSQGQGERTCVPEVLDELARTLERIFREKDVTIDWDAADDLWFQGERQDFMEIAGNAMENAGKWCKAKVRVRAVAVGLERLRLTVEDDGPGLTPAQREEVVRRGARLDENAPGSGLGLSIIDELARAYRGDLTLGATPMGGLSVTVELPRAET